MVVDFQHHFTPPDMMRHDVIRSMPINQPGKTPPHRMPSALTDLEIHVQDMDKSGIDHAVLSCGLGMDGTTLEICRLVNDAMNRACAAHPSRFTALAHTPPLGGKAAMRELERCRGEFNCPGVVIISEPQGLPLDAPELNEFWEACVRLGMYVFVHPALRPEVGELLDKYDLVRSLGREYSMSTATVRVIDGGVLDRFPELKLQMGHLAGGIAVNLDRIRKIQDRVLMGTAGHPKHGLLPERDFDYYLRERLYFDSAGVFGSMTAVTAALAEIPASQIVFGTDYPLEIREPEDLGAFVAALRRTGAPGRAILEGNAGKLVPGL